MLDPEVVLVQIATLTGTTERKYTHLTKSLDDITRIIMAKQN